MGSDGGEAELCARFRRLYVPAIADALDDAGLWHQVMDNEISPLTLGMRVAGVAFTTLGMPERSTDRSKRLGAAMVDRLSPNEVAVFDCAGDQATGHWGELLTNGAIARGAVGAVIDGGVRDTSAILANDFPVFCKFRAARDAKGRWNVVDMQIPVTAGGVIVHPGDIIVGDADGVVVVPSGVAWEILQVAEEVVETENTIRSRVKAGESVGELYQEYERF